VRLISKALGISNHSSSLIKNSLGSRLALVLVVFVSSIITTLKSISIVYF
jgi:hypothetical protein